MVCDEIGIKIFGGSGSVAFAEQVSLHLGIPLGRSDVLTFSEGNTFVRVGDCVRGDDVFVVQSIALNPNNEFMELLFWVDALKRASAHSVTAIIPYFSYAKGDKKDEPRVSIRARVCADCLEAAGVDRIITMDLHSPQIQGFFKKPVDHLSAQRVLTQYVRDVDASNPVIVSPDVGGAKNARHFADVLGYPVAIADKSRYDHKEKAHVNDVIGDVEGRDAFIIDDFTTSCNTLIDAARVLKMRGAKTVSACVTHLLMGQKSVDALMQSPIDRLIATDTVNNPVECEKIVRVSVTGLFASAIDLIHNRRSLVPLFE